MGVLDLLNFFLGAETGVASAGVSIARRIELNSKYSEFTTQLSRHKYCLSQAREAKDKENKNRWWSGAEMHLRKANELRAEIRPLIDWFERTGEPIPIAECVECIPETDFIMPKRKKDLWPF